MASVLVPLAPGFEELEAITIIDLLVRAEINVISAGLVNAPIKASRGAVLIPDMTLDDALEQEFDMVVLPGGQPGADHLNDDPRIQKLLIDMANNGKHTAAVCAAPKVLANLGLLDGKTATSYPGTLEKMALKNIKIVQQSVVVDGNVITSRGPGTAMEFALTLIEILVGRAKRDEVAKGLLYDH